MSDVNNVVLTGRLAKDARIRNTKEGMTAVVWLPLAVKRKWKKDGETMEAVDFIDVVIYGKSAESAYKYLKKGKRICVEGAMRQDKWEREGEKFSRIEVKAYSITFLSYEKTEEENSSEEEIEEEGEISGE
jgi:single-strand DNA-binding protein